MGKIKSRLKWESKPLGSISPSCLSTSSCCIKLQKQTLPNEQKPSVASHPGKWLMGTEEEEIRRNLLLNYWSLRKWAHTQNLCEFNQTDKWARTFLLACYIPNNVFEAISQPHYPSDVFPMLLSGSPTLQFFSYEKKAVVLIARDRYLIIGLVISRVWKIKSLQFIWCREWWSILNH